MKWCTLVVLLAVGSDAVFLRKGDKKCSDNEQAKHDAIYCKSGTCTECCDLWCKDTCDASKEAMEADGCKCAGPPAAHVKASFCEDKAKKYKADHKDDKWETQMGVACSKGCEGCCDQKGLQTFLQAPEQCKLCMAKL